MMTDRAPYRTLGEDVPCANLCKHDLCTFIQLIVLVVRNLGLTLRLQIQEVLFVSPNSVVIAT